MFSKSLLVTTVLGIAALAGSALGQASGGCVGNDLLDLAGCCQPVVPNLPQFPAGAQPGLGVCWNNCVPNQQQLLKVTWDPLFQPSCGNYLTKLHVFDGATGMPMLDGAMTLNYTRTWTEFMPGTTLKFQNWRFTAKADLMNVSPAAVSPGCPVPNCIAPLTNFPTAFFYGYVDYSLDCQTGAWKQAITMYHACDFLIHRPGLAANGGVFHPNRSYGIIAPHTTAAPFIPSNLNALGGAFVAEGLRNATSPAGPNFCSAEDRINVGGMNPIGTGCLCPLAAAPPHITAAVMVGQGTCVDTTGQSANFASQMISFPNIPWPHVVLSSIGSWTNGGVWPGQERVWVDEGLFRSHDVCAQSDAFEVYYGASTRGGWPVIGFPGTALTQNFHDLSDNWTYVLGTTPTFPLFGNVMPTDHLIYLNTP